MRKIQNSTNFIVDVVARVSNLASRLSRRIKSSVTIATNAAIMVLAGHTVSAQIAPS
ncbi:hypothetical protein [Nostoc sp.]|uniref:hypothetical protein n=1 Tax=Nostoc sp. TaxID=1180 RepID=UPI002FF7A55B